METQHPLNVVAEVLPGKVQALSDVLERLGRKSFEVGPFPFARLEEVHFARLVLLPEAIDSAGRWSAANVVLSTNFDGPAERHLQRLVAYGREGLDLVFGLCAGYPPEATRTDEARAAYLRRRSQTVNAFYLNTAGRSVAQVEREARLYRSVSAFADEQWGAADLSAIPAAQMRESILDHVRATPDLAWALEPERDDESGARRRKLELIGAGALALVAVIFLLPALIILGVLFLIVLRAAEFGNLAHNRRPPNAHIRAREQEEDRRVQNQLSAVGFVQNGIFRRMLIRAMLWVLDFGGRNLFYRGQLAGVDTIHFARWVVFDRGRRVYFFSNFDGSPESYQDDFIERVAFGLNLVFSNGLGWPRTQFLLFGGARDEQAFKAYYRDHQIRTQLWYAAPAYDGLTAVNIARNNRFRRGLAAESGPEWLQSWLGLL